MNDKAVKELFLVNPNSERQLEQLLSILLSDETLHGIDFQEYELWRIAEKWIKARELLPESAPQLSALQKALSSSLITKADVTQKGTQLKLLLHLSGGQLVFFKPKRYEIDHIVRGPPYAGLDRHNGEIAAFQLSRLLGMRYAPVATGRRLHIENEIKPVATERLLRTFLKSNESNVACRKKLNASVFSNCFYGQCYYCSPQKCVCPDYNGYLEGSIILLLPERLVLHQYRNPWQRTYKHNVVATWEQDPYFCFNTAMNNLEMEPRILDLIDISVFDYLIGNADRHHYEVFKEFKDSAVLLFDNGKSFGNAYWDEFTILAPLYQCCVIRKSTYERLLLFASTRKGLSGALYDLLSTYEQNPILSDANFDAINRRLQTVISLVNVCINSTNKVLIR
ncbi:glycosaminoglycan xylosylkinase-like protein [Leptotrombidium deliense]|uniref:Glycosaminoglycan xylosylkinase-like protein n=1 Tax=Leptotrombidium deliense TaxID=299467 RepID=A0A443SW81_9ACAR|nr:glycosaminoglycan xylosylkinase-like protein [Leptotrombidium deliense]